MLTAADIDRYFQQYGWLVSRAADDADRWHVTCKGDFSAFTINVALTVDWVIFEVELASQGHYLIEDLLAANARMLLVKFAVDALGRLLLKTELPTEGFAYSHFVDCLGALSHYTDEFLRDQQQQNH